MKLKAIREKIWLPRDDVQAPSKGILCNWVREADETSSESAPLIDLGRYRELLSVLPDNIVENLEKARLARDGRMPMIKAGLGYQELLASIIVDGTAIGTSSAEARLAPALFLPANYMAPGGIPGRVLRFTMRGRETTLITTGATMTFRQRIAATDIITGTTLQASGAVASDTAAAQTNVQWRWGGDVVVRSVGSGGTVFAQGDSDMAAAAVSVANQVAKFSGSAGSATPAAVAFDTTTGQFLQMTGQWSLATAYSIQAHQYMLEALN